MNVSGCFLVVGKTKPPEVHLLSSPEIEFLNARLQRARSTGIAEVRSRVLEHLFGEGTEQLFPCWSKPHMLAVVMEYQGDYEDEVKRIAACIVEGKPYSLDDDGKRRDGGQRAKLDPPKPVKPRPGGAAKRLPVPEKVPVAAGNVSTEEIKLKPRKRK